MKPRKLKLIAIIVVLICIALPFILPPQKVVKHKEIRPGNSGVLYTESELRDLIAEADGGSEQAALKLTKYYSIVKRDEEKMGYYSELAKKLHTAKEPTANK